MHEREIFAAVLEKPTEADRQAFLDEVCAGDAALRNRLQRLLTERANLGSFLDHPAVASVATQILSDTANAADHSRSGSRTIPECDDIPLDFLAPAQEPGSLGRLGQYEILAPVGRGGMGIVLKARDTRLHRIVAVKVLAPELASNPTARKRFLREAQAAAAISHDHVVTIHAVDENKVAGFAERAGQSDLPYLVMEFIDGQSLQQKLDRQGALPLPEILRIGRQIAAGLAAAHAQGLIHRDVKPSNILLQNGVERVQITDFGLARAVDDVSMTRTGEVTGTPQYMSPEQALGLPVDARSDLFCLGSVLYAMCTGRSPFRADSTMASLRRVCDDTPRPIREINPDIPDWLAAIIDRLFEKNPDNRFQTAAEVADLLEQFLAHVQDPRTVRPLHGLPASREPRVRQTGRASWRPRWVAAAMVLGLAVAGLSVTEATGVTRLSATVVRIVTGEGTLVLEIDDPTVEISLDGEELTISGAGLQEVRLRPGQYQFQATKDGSPVQQELVTIHRGDRQVVRVTRNGAAPPPVVAAGGAERGPFVVLSDRNDADIKFDTLREAVELADDGDTIEIRGNGPFVTPPITITRRLTIRASAGFQPVIRLDASSTQLQELRLLTAEAGLVLEGVELQLVPEQTLKGSGSGPFLLMADRAPMYVANCRLRMDVPWIGACIALQRCPLFSAWNSEFVGTATGVGSNGDIPDAARWHIENCVQVGGRAVALGYARAGQQGASITLTHNTFVGFAESTEISLWTPAPSEYLLTGAKPIRLDATSNIVESAAIVCFWQFQDKFGNEAQSRLPSEDAVGLLSRLVDWHGSANVYSAGPTLLGLGSVDGTMAQVSSVADLADWKQFWTSPESDSLQGLVVFQGGALLSRLESTPGTLAPEDFRLLQGSAGYRAGPDGKDLGADVDLVGPGTSYERWKQTQEYQVWLKQTGQIRQ